MLYSLSGPWWEGTKTSLETNDTVRVLILTYPQSRGLGWRELMQAESVSRKWNVLERRVGKPRRFDSSDITCSVSKAMSKVLCLRPHLCWY